MNDEIDYRDLPDIDGLQIRVSYAHDYDAKASDYDCYSDADIKAWHNIRWFFVVLHVEATFDGQTYGDVYLGAVECGECADGTDADPFAHEAITELAHEAVTDAKKAMETLRAKLVIWGWDEIARQYSIDAKQVEPERASSDE